MFLSANLSHSEAQYGTLGLGGINVVMAIVSLILIERLGRRTLHLYGLGVGFIALALLSASFILKVLFVVIVFYCHCQIITNKAEYISRF